MTDDHEGVLFTDGSNRVFLHKPTDYPDGGGHHLLVDLVGGPFQGSIDATSYEKSTGLSQFRQELAALHSTLLGEVCLSQSYENLELVLKGDGRGHMNVRVKATADPMMGNRLKFEFSIDQTQLPAIIAGLGRFLEK